MHDEMLAVPHHDRPAVSHGMAEVEPGVRIHYVVAGDGPRAIVLLHGFPETYRTFEQDATDNRAALAQQGKLTMPVLFAGGELSFSVPLGVEMMEEVAEDVTGLTFPRAGHWIPEEQPDALVAAILELARR